MLPFRSRSNEHPEGPVPIKRRVLSLPSLVSLALAGAFLFFLVTRFDVDPGAAWDRIRDSNPWYLALAVLVHYTTFLFRGARWSILLRNAQEDGSAAPGVLYCSQLVLLGWFANSVAWFRLGDAYRAYLYRDEMGASFSRTIGTLLAERMLDAILVALLLLAAVPFLLGGGEIVTWMVLGTAIFLVVTLTVVFLVLRLAKDRALRMLPGWLAERYQRLQEGAVGSFRQVPPVTILGLLGWLSEVGRLYLVAHALNLGLGIPLVIFITLANSLLTLVPTPGGIGAVESGVAGLLVRLSSLSVNAATALVLVDRSITYVSVIAVGAVLFVLRRAIPQWSHPRHLEVGYEGTGPSPQEPGSEG
ncbi:MAG: flippase-like domain-containing protein [Chloroflexi bacterium]|nr:flippase-like domain-containing protein [Chloroflexota bacterium]